MAPFRFTLYLTGSSVRSQLAVDNIRRFCEREFGANASIRVVDVLEDPAEAERARVLTTPTLILEHPGPERRITGDLTDEGALRRALGLSAGPRTQGDSSS